MNQEQITDAQAARDAALTTPSLVREAMLTAPMPSAGGIALQPYCLGMLWLLQDIKSPLTDFKLLKEAGGKEIPVEFRDVARAALIFSDPDGAFAAYQEDKEGLSMLDQQAFAVARKIPPNDFATVLLDITKVIAAGMATAPVPPGTGGKNGAKPPPKKKGAQRTVVPQANNGCGWTLTLLDMLLAEYGGGGDLTLAIRNIVWKLPLCQAWCLYATTAARYGNEPKGPTFVEMDMLFAIRRSKESSRLQVQGSMGAPRSRTPTRNKEHETRNLTQ